MIPQRHRQTDDTQSHNRVASRGKNDAAKLRIPRSRRRFASINRSVSIVVVTGVSWRLHAYPLIDSIGEQAYKKYVCHGMAMTTTGRREFTAIISRLMRLCSKFSVFTDCVYWQLLDNCTLKRWVLGLSIIMTGIWPNIYSRTKKTTFSLSMCSVMIYVMFVIVVLCWLINL